jgi:acetyl-CoA acyltransferase 1
MFLVPVLLTAVVSSVNPVGGAIAFGYVVLYAKRFPSHIFNSAERSHPLGATGARQVATAYAEAKRSGAKLFVTSMCMVSRGPFFLL